MRSYVQGIILLVVCLVAMMASCRRTQPSLIDRNQPPDTQLWYAPPDSSDYEYKVHMYWRGTDSDGTAVRYIWAIQDTIAGQGLSWNPSLRLRDYRIGRVTTRTDSVFSFRAYRDVNGVGVRKNRQAFFIAAIDDNGVIDPVPAAVEFVATISRLPEIRFTDYIDGKAKPYVALVDGVRDTVGMYVPFSISYHGLTANGRVRGYQYFPLSTTISIPGAGLWSEDLGDTMRTFANTVADPLPAGTFRFAAKCIDDAAAESQVDGDGRHYQRGVAQIVVNFDPDTWMTEASVWSYQNPVQTPINFTDNKPDTVPYKSWVYFRYFAHDDRRDTKLCSVADPDECIDFQIKLVRSSARFGPAGSEDSGWLPRAGVHDSDANSTADSNTVNIASAEYALRAAAVDENGTRDGTPAEIQIVGNFDPVMDTFLLDDHLGNPLSTTAIDTLEWNFWKGIGWPYTEESDTVQSNGVYYKEFGYRFRATGHDDKRDPAGSAIKTWRYSNYSNFQSLSNPGTFVQIGRGGVAWYPGDGNNIVDELARIRVRYNYADGHEVFDDPAAFGLDFVNQVITLVVYGRDTRLAEPDFSQYAFWSQVPVGQKAGNVRSTKFPLNSFGAESSGRGTQPKIVKFYFRFTH